MRLAAAVATAFAVASVAAVPAHAATVKPVCKLIVDDAGDATKATVPGDDSVDLVGGDFASNGKQVTAIINLKAIANPDPQSPLGQAYYVLFTVKGSPDKLTLSAGLFPTGNEFTYGYEDSDPNTGVKTSYTLGAAKGSIVGNSLHITADIAKFPQAKFLKNGNKVTTITAEARRVYGQRVVPSQNVGPARAPLGGATLLFDDAVGKSYTLGAKSCVAIGK